MTLSLPVSPLYRRDQSIVRIYGLEECKKIKVSTLAALRTKGVELDCERSLRGSVNSEKLDESIIRAKNRIFELAFCNPWDYFFTCTLDRRKYKRDNLQKFHSDLTQFIRDQRKKYNCKLHFLLIPELHADGRSWHMHGFIYDLPDQALHKFVRSDKMSKALREKVSNGEQIFTWLDYHKKFGFCDLELIRNHEAVSKYVTKYINKGLYNSVKELNAHLYYHSRGLKFSQRVCVGSLFEQFEYDFCNDFCAVKWLDYSDDTLQKLLDDMMQLRYYPCSDGSLLSCIKK